RLEQIRSAELERNRRRLAALQPFQHRAVEALTRGISNKILHGLVLELQAHAGAPERHVLTQLERRPFGVAWAKCDRVDRSRNNYNGAVTPGQPQNAPSRLRREFLA